VLSSIRVMLGLSVRQLTGLLINKWLRRERNYGLKLWTYLKIELVLNEGQAPQLRMRLNWNAIEQTIVWYKFVAYVVRFWGYNDNLITQQVTSVFIDSCAEWTWIRNGPNESRPDLDSNSSNTTSLQTYFIQSPH